MDLTRRQFFGFGRGAAAAAVLAGLGLASTPRRAKAIIGVDDAVLGAIVVAVATLGGYALYNQYSGNLGLQAIGADFGNYVSSSQNRTAAAVRAAELAALYGLGTTQANFETAAQSISDGTGAFLDAVNAAADTGRLALDGLVSGAGDLVGAFRELVNGYFSSGVLSDIPQTLPGYTVAGPQQTILTRTLYVWDYQTMRMFVGASEPPITVSWAILKLMQDWQVLNNDDKGYFICGDGEVTYVNDVGNNSVTIGVNGNVYRTTVKRNANGLYSQSWVRGNTANTIFGTDIGYVTGDIVSGPMLPGVDRPADAPDVIGSAWDSLPIASDMVISPTTGDIVSAGSIALPTGIPTTAGDYAAALQGSLAGVVADSIALPLSLEASVTVATPAGVAAMPISEAIASETSLQLDYAPDIPIDPVMPPVDVPEGPWTPVVELPFMNVWPFNMIYTFIDTMSRLGGN